jgi:hypothetical protein
VVEDPEAPTADHKVIKLHLEKKGTFTRGSESKTELTFGPEEAGALAAWVEDFRHAALNFNIFSDGRECRLCHQSMAMLCLSLRV